MKKYDSRMKDRTSGSELKLSEITGKMPQLFFLISRWHFHPRWVIGLELR